MNAQRGRAFYVSRDILEDIRASVESMRRAGAAIVEIFLHPSDLIGVAWLMGIRVRRSPVVPRGRAYFVSDPAARQITREDIARIYDVPQGLLNDARYAPPPRDEAPGMTLDELLGKADEQHARIEAELG